MVSRMVLNYADVSIQYNDTWTFCGAAPVVTIGKGWQHLGGTDFQYTPDEDLTSALVFNGILPNRNYLITGFIEVMDAIPNRSSIRVKIGTTDSSLHSIRYTDENTPLIVIGESGTENEFFQLDAWTNVTIDKFIIRDLSITLLAEDTNLQALVDEDMRFLLDMDNALLTSEIQGI